MNTYHLADQCPDCMGHGKHETCYACNHEGCRQCMDKVQGPDGGDWWVCEMCREGIEMLTAEVREGEGQWL